MLCNGTYMTSVGTKCHKLASGSTTGCTDCAGSNQARKFAQPDVEEQSQD